jgi:hypothetical protein
MYWLRQLGIEKGKPFNPTERQKKILIDGAETGELMAKTLVYNERIGGAEEAAFNDAYKFPTINKVKNFSEYIK